MQSPYGDCDHERVKKVVLGGKFSLFLAGHNSAMYPPMKFILVPKDSSFKALSNGGYRWYPVRLMNILIRAYTFWTILTPTLIWQL